MSLGVPRELCKRTKEVTAVLIMKTPVTTALEEVVVVV